MSDPALSDNDINDLLSGVDPIQQIVAEIPPPDAQQAATEADATSQTEPSQAAAPPTETAAQVRAEAYPLGRDPRVPDSGQWPALAAAHQRLAKLLRPRLRLVAMRSIGVTAEGLKVMTHSKLIEALTDPIYYGLTSLRPLQGQGLLCVNSSFVAAVVDHMFGGSGRFPIALTDRDLSISERKIAERIVRALATCLTEATRELQPLEIEILRQDTDVLGISIAGPDDHLVVFELAVTLGEDAHAVRIALPYLSIEPIRRTLSRRQANERPLNHERWMDLLLAQIKEAEVELVAELATADATVADLMALKAGDFIELDLRQSLEVRIADVPVMRCGYGISNGHYAIRVHDFLMAPATTSKETQHVQ